MIELLARHFIKNREDVNNAEVRSAYGALCGFVGIGLNIILFALKFIAGTVSGSIAMIADAFNNLSDAGSSVITLLGFKLANKKPDADHPFGHGRIEYISGLLVSVLILLMGFELLKSSFAKIRNPEPITFSLLAVLVPAAAIFVKFYMSAYNRSIGKKIKSTAMLATATDSLSDCIATGAVLLSTLIGGMAHVNVDGYAGLIVACFILFAGYNAAKDTLSPLLGQPPEPEFVHEIESIVMEQKNIVGIHDLVVHDYGPGRVMISLHAEVPANMDVLELHDQVDCAEEELRRVLHCEATIHMDPIVTDDPKVAELRAETLRTVRQIDERITIHDFRTVPGPTHTNLIFDAVLPHDIKLTEEEAAEEIKRLVRLMNPDCFAVVHIDRAYV